MKKSIWSKILSTVLTLSMLLAMLPATSFSVAAEAIGQAEFLSAISDLNSVIEKNSAELAEVIAVSEDLGTGYGSNAKFLAAIEAPDPTATLIYTAADLDNVRNSLDGNFVLAANIDLSDWGEWVPIGDDSTIASRFTGTFDGQGHVIKNLTITGSTYQYAGLFGYVSSTDTTIMNLGLEDTHIDIFTAASYAGAVYGYSGGVGSRIISNCYNTGNISASYAGGICGYSSISSSTFSSTIAYCYNEGDISAHYAGGICGIGGGTSFYNCYNTGAISSFSSTSNACAGGICGASSGDSTNIVFCYNVGTVSATSTFSSIDHSVSLAGGICGENRGPLSNCFNAGNVYSYSSTNYASSAGGISGSGFGSVSTCYNAGDVSALYFASYDYALAGGICSFNSRSISNCVVLSSLIYAGNIPRPTNISSYLVGDDGEKNRNLALEGISGNAIDDSNGHIVQKQAEDQFTYEADLDWDFVEVWHMVPGYKYPQLQGMPPSPPKIDPTYTVTFNAGDHGKMTPSFASEEVHYQKTVTRVPIITPDTGYDFIGWKSSIDGIDDKFTFYNETAIKLHPVNGAITFTAQYEPKTCTVIFDYNDGTVGTDTESQKSGKYGDTYSVPNPTRTGYTLKGWLPAGIGTFLEADEVILYKAQWEPIKYTVTFEPGNNGAIISGRGSEKVNYGNNVTEIPEISANEGYIFIGWECSKNKSIYIESGIWIYPVTEDVTFTALYADEADATVIFFYNGGTEGDLISSYQCGKPGDTYEPPKPEREGYYFDRWSPSKPSGTFGVAKSITIHIAQWTPEIHTVVFKAGSNGAIDGEENPDEISLKISHDSKVGSVPTVTTNGHIFVGWECSENESIYDVKGVMDYPIRANITFTAQYADEADATVIFFYNGGVEDGKISSYISGAAGDDYKTPEPKKTGYELAGWEGEEGESVLGKFGIAGSITSYTAQWEAVTFKVSFEKGNNGTIDPDDYSEDVSYDEKVTKVPDITPNTGYATQNLWAINGRGGSLYSSGDILEMKIRDNITFVAQYSLIPTGGGGGGGKVETAILTVRAIDKATDVPISVQDIPVSVGETVKVSAPPVKGYVLAEDCEPTKPVTVKTGNNTVDFFYDKKDEPSGLDKRFIVSDKIKEVLETEEHLQYINGYPDGTVRPNSNITRAEVAIIFWRLLKAPEKNEVVANSFSDIKGDESYAQAVQYLEKIGILQGYEDGSFRPSLGITRAEFVAIACRFDDLENSNSNPFTDLAGSHWAYSYIISAYLKGWISGYPDGEFKPQNGISRAEVVKIVNCMLGRGIKLADLPEDLPSFTDLKQSHWAYCEIMEATVSHQFERQEDGWEIWK